MSSLLYSVKDIWNDCLKVSLWLTQFDVRISQNVLD